MSDRPYPELMTPSEVAAIWNVNARTITRWARQGKLPCIRTLGGHRRFRAVDVQAAFEKANRNP